MKTTPKLRRTRRTLPRPPTKTKKSTMAEGGEDLDLPEVIINDRETFGSLPNFTDAMEGSVGREVSIESRITSHMGNFLHSMKLLVQQGQSLKIMQEQHKINIAEVEKWHKEIGTRSQATITALLAQFNLKEKEKKTERFAAEHDLLEQQKKLHEEETARTPHTTAGSMGRGSQTRRGTT